MDKTTAIGLPMAIAAVIIAMIVKGVSLSILFNVPALLIIFVGTASAILVAFPIKDIKNLKNLFRIVIKEQKTDTVSGMTVKVVELSNLARSEGLLALEQEANNIENDFLKHGLNLVSEGLENKEIRELLEEDMMARDARHAHNRGMFTQAGAYAPALGVLGAVFGLMAALSHMEDMEKLSMGIIAAFVATIFGIFSAYVVWTPFSNKLKRKSEEEYLVNIAILEGVLAIERSKPSYFIENLMLSYVPTNERDAIREEIKNAKKKE